MVIDSTIALSLSFFLFFSSLPSSIHTLSLSLSISLSLSQTPEMYAIQWDILPFLIPSPEWIAGKIGIGSLTCACVFYVAFLSFTSFLFCFPSFILYSLRWHRLSIVFSFFKLIFLIFLHFIPSLLQSSTKFPPLPQRVDSENWTCFNSEIVRYKNPANSINRARSCFTCCGIASCYVRSQWYGSAKPVNATLYLKLLHKRPVLKHVSYRERIIY